MSGRGIFQGVKVLSIARQIAAPFATYQLALHGAEVLSIENPKEPDSMRYVGDVGTALNKQGMASSFLAQGSNKKSITLNIAEPQGKAIFLALAAESDILVENLIAGTMARYGLGYEDLRAINPRLVYCSVTGYGQTGPASKRAAIDPSIQAASGLMSINGTQQSGPLRTGYTMVDYATGYAAALGIVSALYHAKMTGEGQHVDVAMLDTAITMASADMCETASGGNMKKLRGNGDGRYVSNAFRCREGVLVVAATTDSRRLKLWTAIERLDILEDPRFATPELARANYPAMHEEIERALASRTALEWEGILSDAGVASMAVRSLKEGLELPQLVHRGLMHKFDHDESLGRSVVVPKAPYKLSGTPAEVRSLPPRYGQHTDEVLRRLGHDDAAIAQMRERGVI